VDVLRSILQDISEDMLDEEQIIDEYTYMYGRSPEEILCEKETRQEVSHLIPLAAEFLDYEDRNILIGFIVQGKTMTQIASDLKITQQAVSDRLKKIPYKLKKYYHRFADKIPYFNYAYGGVTCGDSLSLNFISEYHPQNHTSMKPSFIFEYYENRGVGGYWGTMNEKPSYKTKVVCDMNRYIPKDVVCSLCKECKREVS